MMYYYYIISDGDLYIGSLSMYLHLNYRQTNCFQLPKSLYKFSRNSAFAFISSLLLSLFVVLFDANLHALTAGLKFIGSRIIFVEPF